MPQDNHKLTSKMLKEIKIPSEDIKNLRFRLAPWIKLFRKYPPIIIDERTLEQRVGTIVFVCENN